MFWASRDIAEVIKRLSVLQADFLSDDPQTKIDQTLPRLYSDLQDIQNRLVPEEPLTETEANLMQTIHILLRKRGDGPAEQLLYSFHARDYGRKVFTAFCRILLKVRSVGDCLDNLKHDYDLISTREDREMLYALQINEEILYAIWKDIKDQPWVNPKES
jgi:hypothetical protein